MAQYASTIANLNNNRLSGMPFDLVQQLAETSKVLGGEKESFLRQAWDLLASILGPVDKERLLARGYSLQASAYTSADASSFRRKVARGARAFYEREFALLVDKKIQSNVSAARLSGPGARAQAVSYANLALRNRDRWALPGLELLGSGDQAVPLWAVLFYLMRMGKGEEAIAFAESESVRDKLERDGDSNLVAYLRYWVALSTNPDGEERAMRDQIANEFNARIKTRNSMDAAGTQQGDPFKLAVYKVLGRCELSRKMIPGPWVVVGTEDYVWLQLVLSREGDDLSGGETYGIRDMARHFIRFGPEYFNPAGNTGNPLVWFMVLLACGEFERAAAYLVAQDRYAVEGIHFAVTLAWAGVLRVPDTVGAGIELLGEVEVADAPPVSAYPSTPTITRFGSTIRAQVANNLPAYKLATFDFARLMHSYTRSFYRTDPKRALQYLYLICIYGKLDAGESDAQKTETYNSVAHRYIRDLVLDTREFGALLGSVRTDGTRVPGELEKFAPLLNLPTPAAFIASITKKAAEHAERDGGRFNDAVQLYNLAEDYDTVMRLINRYLGETLAQRQFAIAGVGMDQGVDAFGRQMPVPLGGSTGTGAIEEALRIASELAAYYDASPALSAKVSPEERETCSVLTSLLKFMQDYEEAKLESALQRQVDLGILPLDVRERTSRAEPTPTPAELMIIRRKALAVSSLNENVARSMPMIIVATMDCIYRLWRALRSSSFQDPARLAVAKEYKMMADNIVMFAGQMEYRMAPDVFSKLNRLAVVYMS